MEQEIPKPPSSAPSFYVVQDGMTYRCWRLKRVEIFVQGRLEEGDHMLIQVEPPLDIAKSLSAGSNGFTPSKEDFERSMNSEVKSSAFLLMTLIYNNPKDGEWHDLWAPLAISKNGQERFDRERCIYCGGWSHLASEEEALNPKVYQRKQKWRARALEWLGCTCVVLFFAILIALIGSFFYFAINSQRPSSRPAAPASKTEQESPAP